MKGFIVSLSLLLSFSTSAAVTGFLKKENNPFFLIQGFDAQMLYDYLLQKETQTSATRSEKRISLVDGALDLHCTQAKVEYAPLCSCRLAFRTDKGDFTLNDDGHLFILQTGHNELAASFFSGLKKDSRGVAPMFLSESKNFAFVSSQEELTLSYRR